MDLIAKLTSDHKRFEQLSDELDRVVLGCYGERDWRSHHGAQTLALLRELLPELARHERLEHRLFKAVIEAVPGAAAVEAMEKEHGQVRELLWRFEQELVKEPGQPSPWVLLNLMRLTTLLQRHMRFEEEEVFPLARRALRADQLEATDEKEGPALRRPS